MRIGIRTSLRIINVRVQRFLVTFSKSRKRWTYKPLWQHTVHLWVFSWPTRLPMARESIAKVPNQTGAKRPNCFSSSSFFLSFFRRASSMLREPLTLVYARNSSKLSWAVHDPIVFHNFEVSQDACNHPLHNYGSVRWTPFSYRRCAHAQKTVT